MPTEQHKRSSLKGKAQTATELAIFGSILIFVIGAMLRTSVVASYNQNQSLKAMRLALRSSFTASMSADDGNTGNSSRNSAGLLFIEDRTTPDVNKHGSLERAPFVVSANGSFSRNLFKTADYGSTWNLPVYDMMINGQQFTFTVANFAEYPLGNPLAPDWRDPCVPGQPVRPNPPGPASGCNLVYSFAPNLNIGFNSASSTSASYCIADPCTNPNSELTADQRFDLNRDGVTDVAAGLRATFSWQWLGFTASTNEIDLRSGKNLTVDVDGDLKEEQVIEYFDAYGSRYTWDDGPENKKRPIARIRVVDSQKGDLDFTWDATDLGPRPGLKEEMRMYSLTRPGTYLLIQEGKLYNPEANTFVRSIQKRDKIDVIERQVQLSNDTGTFCARNAATVEVCGGGCMNAGNLDRTCFDAGSRILYVRSRIEDLRGRKWKTDVTLGP